MRPNRLGGCYTLFVVCCPLAIAKEPGSRFAPPIPHSPCPNTWDIAQIELNAYIQQQADEVAPTDRESV